MERKDLIAELQSIRLAEDLPGPDWFAEHLRHQRTMFGDKTAFDRFSRLMQVVADRFGPEKAAVLSRILRDARVSVKPARKSKWDQAEHTIARLPGSWQDKMGEVLHASKHQTSGGVIWSASYIHSVALALARWDTYCKTVGIETTPTGSSLDTYAQWLMSPRIDKRSNLPTQRTACDYITRIVAGMRVIHANFKSDGCDFVLRDYSEAAKRIGPTTKSGAQLVGASTIYALGFELMEQARSARLRGVQAALQFRNGLILSIAAALPERARALSSLSFGSSVRIEGDHLHINIDGRYLKQKEKNKTRRNYRASFKNAPLAEALQEYMLYYRPIFDDGTCLFPSRLSNRPISEQQIGALSRNITMKKLNVAITVHRIRDNVATEASEHLSSRAATALLRHRNEAITKRHYDHSEGLAATVAFGAFIDNKRSSTVKLDL